LGAIFGEASDATIGRIPLAVVGDGGWVGMSGFNGLQQRDRG
jgi:hypothetical protein